MLYLEIQQMKERGFSILIERLNQEVRRREKIISNQTSANRLIGAVLMDLHDEWIHSSRKYINFDK